MVSLFGCDVDMVSNFELKSFDGCVNLYLGLVVIIVVGMDGFCKYYQFLELIGEFFLSWVLQLQLFVILDL